MGASTWEQAKALALANLAKSGQKTGKIPDPKMSYTKFTADMAKLSKEFDTAVDQAQAKILAMQTQCASMKAALKSYEDQNAKGDYGLAKAGDPMNREIAIKTSRDMLDNFADSKIAAIESTLKALDELEKHTVAMEKFEAET